MNIIITLIIVQEVKTNIMQIKLVVEVLFIQKQTTSIKLIKAIKLVLIKQGILTNFMREIILIMEQLVNLKREPLSHQIQTLAIHI